MAIRTWGSVPQGTLVDSNVVLDILTEDQTWLGWSTNALAEAAETGPLYINPIIYSEVSILSRLRRPVAKVAGQTEDVVSTRVAQQQISTSCGTR